MTKTDDFKLMLMNTEFKDIDIDKSDIGTWYLQESGLVKILKACKEAGLMFVIRGKRAGLNLEPIEVE